MGENSERRDFLRNTVVSTILRITKCRGALIAKADSLILSVTSGLSVTGRSSTKLGNGNEYVEAERVCTSLSGESQMVES